MLHKHYNSGNYNKSLQPHNNIFETNDSWQREKLQFNKVD